MLLLLLFFLASFVFSWHGYYIGLVGVVGDFHHRRRRSLRRRHHHATFPVELVCIEPFGFMVYAVRFHFVFPETKHTSTTLYPLGHN